MFALPWRRFNLSGTARISAFRVPENTQIPGGSYLPLDIDIMVSGGNLINLEVIVSYLGGGSCFDAYVPGHLFSMMPTGDLKLIYASLTSGDVVNLKTDCVLDTPLPLIGSNSSITNWNISLKLAGVVLDSRSFCFTATNPNGYPAWTVTSVVPHFTRSPAVMAVPVTVTIECNIPSPKNISIGILCDGANIPIYDGVITLIKGSRKYIIDTMLDMSSVAQGNHNLCGVATYPQP
jgi:hypothetical protein